MLKQIVAQNKDSITTEEVAKAVNLTCGVTSSYLSQLYKEGLVTKYGTKPVFWGIQQKEGALEQFIGANGSLKSSIVAAKSAVN